MSLPEIQSSVLVVRAVVLPAAYDEEGDDGLLMRLLMTTVAVDLGYESPSAFSAMFRRSLGIAPRAFIGRNEYP